MRALPISTRLGALRPSPTTILKLAYLSGAADQFFWSVYLHATGRDALSRAASFFLTLFALSFATEWLEPTQVFGRYERTITSLCALSLVLAVLERFVP